MTDNVNDRIHDELISHDISLRRIDGDATKRVERRLDKLGVALRKLTIEIDPFGTDRADAQERRLARLEKESDALIKEAYKEISRDQRGELRQIAAIETEATVQAIGKSLP